MESGADVVEDKMGYLAYGSRLLTDAELVEPGTESVADGVDKAKVRDTVSPSDAKPFMSAVIVVVLAVVVVVVVVVLVVMGTFVSRMVRDGIT